MLKAFKNLYIEIKLTSLNKNIFVILVLHNMIKIQKKIRNVY